MVLSKLSHVSIFPATHYAVGSDYLKRALEQIEKDRDEAVKQFEEQGKLIEAQRIKERVFYDLEMMREVGYCNGIEQHLCRRQAAAGSPAGC